MRIETSDLEETPTVPIDFHAILPEMLLAGTAILVLVVDLFLTDSA